MTEQQIETKRREILKKLREDEISKMGGEHSIAGFDHMILRERLKEVMPLQKLYERVFFDDYDLATACRQFDSFKDRKYLSSCNLLVGSNDFKDLFQASYSERHSSHSPC